MLVPFWLSRGCLRCFCQSFVPSLVGSVGVRPVAAHAGGRVDAGDATRILQFNNAFSHRRVRPALACGAGPWIRFGGSLSARPAARERGRREDGCEDAGDGFGGVFGCSFH